MRTAEQKGNHYKTVEPEGVPLGSLSEEDEEVTMTIAPAHKLLLGNATTGTNEASNVRAISSWEALLLPRSLMNSSSLQMSNSISMLLGSCFMALSFVASLLTVLWLKWSSTVVEDETSQEPPEGTITSVAQIWGITSVNLAYGFMICSAGVFVIPKEAQQMFPQHRGIALGGYGAMISCSMIFGPIFGRISDSFKHPLGRRRPIIHLSIHVASAFTAAMWVSSTLGWKYVFGVSLLLQQIMWNSAHAAQSALLVDLVEPSRKDASAGIQVASLLMGAFAAIAVFQSSVLLNIRFEYNYMIMMFLSWAILPILHISATEVRSDNLTLPPQLDWRQPATSGMAVFDLGADCSPDFVWLTIERGAYYGGVAPKAFIFFFLRDGIGITDSTEQAMFMENVAYVTEFSAALAGLMASVLFSVTTLQSRTLAACGAFCMGLSSQFWVCRVWQQISIRKLCMILCAFSYGSGQGCYLSADFALTVATIPDPNEASRYMAFWGVSAFIGGGLGSVFAGISMEVFGKLLPEHWGIHVASGSYHIAGYVALLTGTLLCNITAGIICLCIRTRAEQANPQDAMQPEFNLQDGG